MKIQAQELRFIPAYAGNTMPSLFSPPCSTVHPRVRGEHMNARWISAKSSGSSPRTRGTRLLGEGLEHVERFIPAYAGNTYLATRSSTFDAVHPRVRGEHPLGADLNSTRIGSSPRTRGTQYRLR